MLKILIIRHVSHSSHTSLSHLARIWFIRCETRTPPNRCEPFSIDTIMQRPKFGANEIHQKKNEINGANEKHTQKYQRRLIGCCHCIFLFSFFTHYSSLHERDQCFPFKQMILLVIIVIQLDLFIYCAIVSIICDS